MRIHAAFVTTCLAGTAALGGCADIPLMDDTFTLSNAASMRVEVEVYKGPLSKTLPVQWGELEGLVDTAVESLADFGEVICQANNSKSPDPFEKGSKPVSCRPGCENASTAASSVSGSTEPGYQILLRMYADARCLLEEAEELQDVVRRSQPGSPGCHINQALAALHEFTTGPCAIDQARTPNKFTEQAGVQIQAIQTATDAIGKRVMEVQKTVAAASVSVDAAGRTIDNARTELQEIGDAANTIAEDTENVREAATVASETVGFIKESITETRTHLVAALDAAENVRNAASEAAGSVEIARKETAAASEYVDHRASLTNAQEAGATFEKRLIDMADLLDEFRDAIVEAAVHARKVEALDRDTNGLRDALAEIHRALHDAKLLAAPSKQARLAGTMAFNGWLRELRKLDGPVKPAKGFIANEAAALSPLVASNGSSLESVTQTVGEIASELETRQTETAEIRTRAVVWHRLLAAAASELEMNRATVADLRIHVAGVENKIDLLATQLEKDHSSLHRALGALEAAQTKTTEFSDAANDGIPDRPWETVKRESIVRQIGDLAVKLKSKAFYWAETHTALAPNDREVRIAMAGFANLASELSNQLESRADALQWQLDERIGADARKLPLSLYLRDAEPTDFVNLYTWNRAADWPLWEDVIAHPWNTLSSDETADRVRVIERLFADHNWGKINTVYGSGQGDFAMALVKDEIGNWSLKSFESDPTKLVKAYTNLTLDVIDKTRRKVTGSGRPQPELLRLTGNLAAGRIGEGAGPFDVFDTKRLHERVVGELTGIRDTAVKTRNELAAKRDKSARKVVESEAKARSAEARAEAALPTPGPATCAAPESCSVEMVLANARKAETEALEAKISVRTMTQGSAKDAASMATALADKAVTHVRKAEAEAAIAAANATPQPLEGEPSEQTETATATNADEAMKKAHLLAEKAKAFADAATAWAAHADALAEHERAAAALNTHRAEVNARIRGVLNDYAAVIATLLESRTPATPVPK